jgi:CO/xanthine dehydrogenase FAD-binding subunit
MIISDFIKPKNIEEAVEVLHQLGSKAVIMAGSTAFQFLTTDAEKTAIDINLLDLKEIKLNQGTFSVGALTTVSTIQEFSAEGWVLNRVAKKLSTQQIRNMSTLGGNIAQVFPWSDFPVALLALDAEITTFDGKNSKIYKADEFFKQQPAKLLNNKLLIVEVNIPSVTDKSGFGYHKEVRTSGGFSTLTGAAYITCENGFIKDVKIAAGAALGLSSRLTVIEDELKGKPAEKNVIDDVVKSLIKEYSWKGKEGTTDSYAAHLAEVIMSDVLTEALQNAKGEVK